MAPADDLTLGELSRNIDSLRGDIHELTGKVETQTISKDTLSMIVSQWATSLAASEAQQASSTRQLERRIEDLEGWRTWALRIVIGVVIVALLALLIHNAAGSNLPAT